MASQMQFFGCHGTLTKAQLESGLALTTRCFSKGGCRYDSGTPKVLKREREEPIKQGRMLHSLPFRTMNSGKSPDALVENLFGQIAGERKEPIKQGRMLHSLPFRTMNSGKPADALVENLFGPIAGMQVNEPDHASASRTGLTPQLSTFHFEVKTPDGIESQYLTTTSGEKILICDSTSSDSMSNDSEGVEDGRPRKRVCTTSDHSLRSLPERYVHWLSRGQRGEAPRSESSQVVGWHKPASGGYTRALEPLGPWDDDSFNEFMHPCLPDVTYILAPGENRNEIEGEMVKQYGFAL